MKPNNALSAIYNTWTAHAVIADASVHLLSIASQYLKYREAFEAFGPMEGFPGPTRW
jgi:hypothetical protein